MSRKREPGDKPARRKRAPARAPGLPDPRSVIEEKTFTSPKGNRYRILRTTETDPYDPPAPGKKRRR